MRLDQVALGAETTVVEVGGQGGFRRRLMELGLLPGTAVVVQRVAPLGDPLELRVRGCRLSIRRSEASFIEVLETERARDRVPSVSSRPPALSPVAR